MILKEAYSDVFSITRAVLYNEELKISEGSQPADLYKMLVRARIAPMAYNVMSKSAFTKDYPEEIMAVWKRETYNKTFRQMFMTSELLAVVNEGKKRGITLVLFKGLPIASLYPDPNLRTSSDADIYVYPEQQKEAVKLLEDRGFTSIDDGAKEHVPVFVKKNSNFSMKIELHDCLWEDYEGKQAEILETLHLSDRETLVVQKNHGIEYNTLGYTEHLIFQLFHIVKHLFFEGISFRYFVDITLYVNKYFDDIDWNKVRNDMKLLHYERFLDCIVCICQRYIGMRKDVPGIEPVTEEMIEHLIEDVLGEKEPTSNKDMYETINFLSTYFMRTTAVKESKFQQKRKQILPMPSELHERFSYAKEHPILLPVAWVHRVFYFIGYKRDCKKYGKDANAAIKKSGNRLDLMRELNLMDTDKDTKRKGD